ncbi:MAG: pimeloyl-ACP methyl ester carboxylesterase [Flavobacteriaceae bacterium]|jgi:pimeloyl-ACP methyl ester carboxylesterase
MSDKKIPVYFVPGLAAGKEIFRNILLPKTQYQTNVLEWLIPAKNEALSTYSARMASLVKEPNAVLVGVSFGGVIAQEMSVFLDLRRLIIISSIKTRNELPQRLKIAAKTLVYKLVPTSLVLSASDLTKFAIGPKTAKRLKLYQEYLHVRDKRYLDWAIEQMVTWKRNKEIEGVVHLHGDSDLIFPIKNISNCIQIKGGTHIMLLNKGSLITRILIEIMEEN